MPLQDLDLDIVGEPPTIVVPEVKIHEVVILEGLSPQASRPPT